MHLKANGTSFSALADFLQKGYVAEFVTDEDTFDLELVGLEETINNLDIGLVTGNINVKVYMEENKITNIEKGIFVMPVTLTLPEGIIQKTPVNIGVKFKKK